MTDCCHYDDGYDAGKNERKVEATQIDVLLDALGDWANRMKIAGDFARADGVIDLIFDLRGNNEFARLVERVQKKANHATIGAA